MAHGNTRIGMLVYQRKCRTHTGIPGAQPLQNTLHQMRLPGPQIADQSHNLPNPRISSGEDTVFTPELKILCKFSIKRLNFTCQPSSRMYNVPARSGGINTN